MPAKDRTEKSRLLAEMLQSQLFYQGARKIFTYVPLDYEVDTRPVIEQAWRDKKIVAVPLTNGTELQFKKIESFDDLTPSRFGILGPSAAVPDVQPESDDVVIVPGLAFTAKGHRLGRGAGYYDRWLARLPEGVVTVSLLFRFQITKSLPTEPHDIQVANLLTLL